MEATDLTTGEVSVFYPILENSSLALAYSDSVMQDVNAIVRAINAFQCADEEHVQIDALSVPNLQVVPLTPFCENRIIPYRVVARIHIIGSMEARISMRLRSRISVTVYENIA